jgi:hypothetical protein
MRCATPTLVERWIQGLLQIQQIKRFIVTSFMLKLFEAAIAAYRQSGLRVRVHYVWAGNLHPRTQERS